MVYKLNSRKLCTHHIMSEKVFSGNFSSFAFEMKSPCIVIQVGRFRLRRTRKDAMIAKRLENRMQWNSYVLEKNRIKIPKKLCVHKNFCHCKRWQWWIVVYRRPYATFAEWKRANKRPGYILWWENVLQKVKNEKWINGSRNGSIRRKENAVKKKKRTKTSHLILIRNVKEYIKFNSDRMS